MGTRCFFLLKSHFDDMMNHKICLYDESLCKIMVWFLDSFWIFVCKYLLSVFGFITRHTFRYHEGENDSNNAFFHSLNDNHTGPDISEESDFDDDGGGDETESSVLMEETATISNTSNYVFMPGNDVCGFLEEPKAFSFSFHIHEVGLESISESYNKIKIHEIADEEFKEIDLEKKEVEEDEETEISYEINKSVQILETEKTEENDQDNSEEIQLEKSMLCPKLETFSTASDDEITVRINKIDSSDDEIESETFSITHEEKTDESLPEIAISTKNHSPETISDDQELVSEDEFIELVPNSTFFTEEFFSRLELEKSEDDEHESNVLEEESQKPKLAEEYDDDSLSVPDSDDELGSEVLREHDDYIKQLKLELKHVKNRGLPTILEESESPRLSEDLNPLQINTKMEHKDRVEEIHKFYKSYAQKMRKLDVLNDQTMHAIGILKLKDSARLTSTTKLSFVPSLTSIFSQKFNQSKIGNHEDDPTIKYMKDLQRDFELVYISQICLCWEILHWQHRKIQELQDYAFKQYNHVADEFQQFQVLLQRFIEDEPFQKKSRIQNYVENRCFLRTFLQVPVVKEDCMKDKKNGLEGEYVISIGILSSIIEESIRIFWEFIHADKYNTNVLDIIELEDLEFLLNLQTSYQKKEKKLKEALRSKTCMVKKFQKTKENRSERALFYAQIELKLVSKVMNMSRLTRDQLLWCHKKLESIKFSSGRNICIEEPSFLLFPF